MLYAQIITDLEKRIDVLKKQLNKDSEGGTSEASGIEDDEGDEDDDLRQEKMDELKDLQSQLIEINIQLDDALRTQHHESLPILYTQIVTDLEKRIDVLKKQLNKDSE